MHCGSKPETDLLSTVLAVPIQSPSEPWDQGQIFYSVPYSPRSDNSYHNKQTLGKHAQNIVCPGQFEGKIVK